MTQPLSDDVPFHLSSDASFIIREILVEMAPSGPDIYDQIAAECDKGANTFEGGPELAHEVAAELRRRARSMRDATR